MNATTRLDILRGTLGHIADLIPELGHPHAIEKAMELCARAEGECTDALDEHRRLNPVAEAWACIVDSVWVNDEAADEAMDELEARQIDAAHVHVYQPAIEEAS